MSKLTVKATLWWAFGSLLGLLALTTALSWWGLATAFEDFEQFVQDDTARVAAANDVLDAANARAMAARDLVLATADGDRDSARQQVQQAQAAMDQALRNLQALVARDAHLPDDEKRLAQDIVQIEARYAPLAASIVSQVLAGQHEAAIDRMNRECRPMLARLLGVTEQFITAAKAGAVHDVQKAEAHFVRNRNQMIGVAALALLVAGTLGQMVTRRLTRSLGAEPAELSQAAHRVAEGQLGPVPGASQAPAGSVLASLGSMQARLAGIVGQVRQSADSIATGSTQVATGSLDLSQRTEEQASNLQQTAASMEQISATVQQSADTAQQARTLASQAADAVTAGGEAVGRVVTTMDSIAQASRRITDIIGVIDGIAFQTNILALNAAVEAARAGEQGRGFAVVASEVRSLAQRSAKAASEIKTLIGDSAALVEQGGRDVGQAGASMGGIVAQVRQVSDLIGQISNATLQQTEGIQQVSHAVNLLDQVTQQNAALVEESAAAADSLQQQSARLADAVRVFQL